MKIVNMMTSLEGALGATGYRNAVPQGVVNSEINAMNNAGWTLISTHVSPPADRITLFWTKQIVPYRDESPA